MHRRAFVLGCFALLMAAGQPVGLAQQSTPSITSLTPSTGHFADSVTIGGSNFGSTQGSSTVTFNGVAAVAFDSWTDTAIVALVPAGATIGPVVVTVAGHASNGVTFTVKPGTGSGLLQITSPADGAVVAPGDTVNVNVSSPDNSTFIAVAVSGIGNISHPVSTLPAQFAVTVPPNSELRRYTLTALGVTTGAAQTSVSITVDVERSTLPQSIAPDMRQFIFQAEGETDAIDLIAHFSDGRDYRVRESSYVTYSSSDPTVATVDASGIVTAVGEGEAQITARYGPSTSGISTRIPVSVPPPLLVALPPQIDFGDQAVGTSSAPQQMTLTNNSSDALTITNVGTMGDYSQTNTCASSTLAPGATCTVAVTFGPTATGTRPGAVIVSSSSHIVPVKFPLTGNGVGR